MGGCSVNGYIPGVSVLRYDFLIHLRTKAIHHCLMVGPMAMSVDDAIEAVRQEFWADAVRKGLWKRAATNEYARMIGAAYRVIFEREVAEPVRRMLT